MVNVAGWLLVAFVLFGISYAYQRQREYSNAAVSVGCAAACLLIAAVRAIVVLY